MDSALSETFDLAQVSVLLGRFIFVWTASGEAPLDTLLPLMDLLPSASSLADMGRDEDPIALLPTLDDLPIGYVLDAVTGTPVA